MRKFIYRSAKTGRLITEAEALESPETSVKEEVRQSDLSNLQYVLGAAEELSDKVYAYDKKLSLLVDHEIVDPLRRIIEE